ARIGLNARVSDIGKRAGPIRQKRHAASIAECVRANRVIWWRLDCSRIDAVHSRVNEITCGLDVAVGGITPEIESDFPYGRARSRPGNGECWAGLNLGVGVFGILNAAARDDFN